MRATREALSIEAADLARQAKMAYSTLIDLENDRQKSSRRLHAIADALSVNAKWLETGRGPKESRGAGGPGAPTVVPFHLRFAGAGDGAENLHTDEAKVGGLYFQPESLNRKHIHPDSAAVFIVRGDSMRPRLKPGDAILFDQSQTGIRDGAMYVIEWGEGSDVTTRVKRLRKTTDGRVEVYSDNTADPAFARPDFWTPGSPGMRILGRVRWIGSWED